MANDFKIIISATDKATATVKKVNDSISRFVRPITEIKKASAALGKELGIERMGKSMAKVSTAAKDVSESIGHIIAPLASVFGIGSIAAIGEFAKKWGDVGAEIGRTSTTLGVSTRDLQLWRGAASLAGVSADAMTSGMKSLGDTMQDAVMNRNQMALGVMTQLHLNLSRTKTGAVDVTKALMDMSRILNSYSGSPQVQSKIASIFGLEALLPLLREGPDAVKRYLEQVKKTGAIMSGPALEAANVFRQKMELLKLSLSGLKNTIGSRLIPVLQPLIEKMTAWITVNKDFIAQEFSRIVKEIADELAKINWVHVIKGVEEFCSGVNKAVHFMGVWKFIMKAFILLMGAQFLIKIATATKAIWTLVSAFAWLAISMLSTPVGWIILAIGIVIAIATVLVARWDRVKLWWKHLWGGMSDEAYANAKKILDAKRSLLPPDEDEDENGDVPMTVAEVAGNMQNTVPGPANTAKVLPAKQMLELIRKVENSGDNAVSPKGAIGRYQIMPNTAIQYGFDPKKLTNPAYNETVAMAIYKDLFKRYNGDSGAILAGWDGGPGAANTLLARGTSALLPETQNYLNKAHGIMEQMEQEAGIMGQTGPAVETPYSAPSEAGGNQVIAQNGPGAGSVTVLISFENAPRGMKTKTETNGLIIANTKISYAMPEFGVT